ncbi:zinc finger protein 845-like [Copidosoma floridanum]|uniref:zinc finger protein 845-like n=1 Tax=Copidosoma floridanum TaxID=29053 RepID=UPI000C6F9DC6|nr:zinc finger protein 845-like [Copidosoma floridanum]
MDVCRVCLEEAPTMVDLFYKDSVLSLADRLMFLSNVKVAPDDGLPSQICCECGDKLDLSYKFKLQVEESHAILKEKFDSFNVKQEFFFHDADVNISCDENVEDVTCDDLILPANPSDNTTREFEVRKHEDQDEKHAVSTEIQENQESHKVDGEVQEVSEKNQDAQDELEEITIKENGYQTKIQEELNEIQQLAMHEHDYVESQLVGTIEEKHDNKCQTGKKLVKENLRHVNVQEAPILNESIRRSKRKLVQQKSPARISSDEESYFENLNLSCRLKRVQEKSEKIYFLCYWCDKQYLSREILREHMFSHEEVKKTLSLVGKSVEKMQLRKTSEKSSSTTFSPSTLKPPLSGKKVNTCPHCGKEYLYVISYKKHLKQHRKEIKASKEVSMPLEVTVCRDEDDLDFHSFDDTCAINSDSDNEKSKAEKLKEEEEEEEIEHRQSIDTPEKYEEDEAENILIRLKSKRDLSAVEKNNVLKQKDESTTKFRCLYCPYTFNHEKALTLHLKIHKEHCELECTSEPPGNSQPKDYCCNDCGKNFGMELMLRNHLIATGHRTTVEGEQYDLSKRIKRVAAKAALKVIDKIKTDLDCEGSDDERSIKNEAKDADFDVHSEMTEKIKITTDLRSPASRNKVLFCATCNQKCSSKQALTKHMEQHTKEENSTKQENSDDGDMKDDDDYGIDDWPMDNYECPTCKKKYSTKKSLLRHQLLHEEPNFECDICSIKFHRKDKLKAHYDKCSEKNPDQVRKCNICNDIFKNNEVLKEHRLKHVAEGILTEEDLLEMDPKPEEKSEDKGTRKRRTDIVGLECTECNKRYTSRKGLLRHLQVHEGKKFLCDMCPKKFYRREHLKIHVAKHNIVKPYKCHKCPKRFIKEELLNNHLLKHDRVPRKPKESTNDGTKRFLCEICSKSFTQSTTLVAHLRAHNGIKPYVCDVCSRPFTTNAYLKMHMRTHTQERPYICQYCSRAFARADTLANHLTSHTGEAKYHCKFCPKHFRRLKSLKEHVFIHTGQRPYACPTCDRKFNNNGSRYAHSKRCKQHNEQQTSQSGAIMHDIGIDSEEQAQIVMMTEEQEREEEEQQLQQHQEEDGEGNVAQLHLINEADLQVGHVTQHQVVQRIDAVATGQILKPQSIKTITLARPVDGSLGQQHVVGQEILMPLILPFTVTLGEVGDEVILSEDTKIFTT